MLDSLFEPNKIAVIGASRHEGKTGHEVFDNLLHEFEGEVVPVNPEADEVEGVEAYDEVPEGFDMVVVAVPAHVVPDVMEDAAGKDVEAAVVISAGFSESNKPGLEEEIVSIAEENDIDLLGPNVLGLINTESSMNASFSSEMPEKGDILFMSQSGAFCTSVLDYSKSEHIGFKHFVSLGNKALIDEVDLLKKWREDDSEVILSYTEGIEDGREFLKEAIETSREKPVITVKAGRTSKGGEAASSHTGSMAGNYQAYQAAFRKSGIIEAESIRELLDFGRAFAYQPLPEGENLMIITNAGGPGVITADEVEERGLELAEPSPETKMDIDEFLPAEAEVGNPLDLIGDSGHTRYRKALEAVQEDENIDGMLVLLTPQSNTEIDKTAKSIVKASKEIDKPVLTCFMGEKDVASAIDILERNDVPEFEDPVDAVKAFRKMKDYREFLQEDPIHFEAEYEAEQAHRALQEYSGYMDGHELLEAYGFDLPETVNAEAPHPAEEAAVNVGYPIVMKINSPDVSHKTDLDGIRKNVQDRQEVNDSFHEIVNNVHHEKPGSEINGVIIQEQVEGLEVALGMKRDSQFGPMIMVGLGGIYVEALQDISFGIAPISEQEAVRMVEELDSSNLFEGFRGEKHSIKPVKEAIIKLGELALNHEEIQEIDINPLILKKDKAYAADIEIELE